MEYNLHVSRSITWGVVGIRANPSLYFGMRTAFGSRNDLDRLYDQAEANPTDVKRQASLMAVVFSTPLQTDLFVQVLAEEDPEEAIRRYRSNEYAVDDTVIKHYITALVNANKLKSADLSDIAIHYADAGAYEREASFVNATTQYRPSPLQQGTSSKSTFDDESGTQDSPLVVAMQVQLCHFRSHHTFLSGTQLQKSIMAASENCHFPSNINIGYESSCR